MAKKNPYKILGVKKTASKAEIKKVYRTRAKKLHPDVGGDSNVFAELGIAYNLLMDDSRRATFDSTGETEIKSEDVIRNQAFGIVGNLFVSFVSQNKANWKSKEVKKSLLTHLTEAKKGILNNLAICEKEIEFWESVKGDVFFTGGELDPINTALDEKAKAISIQKIAVEMEIKTLTLAIEMVKKYDFKKPLTTQYITRYQYATTASAT